MENKPGQCWDFVMSSFTRSYGVSKVMENQRFHELALQWCDDNNYECKIHLDDLRKVDAQFRNLYESDYI